LTLVPPAVCPNCGRSVIDPAAQVCAWCREPLGELRRPGAVPASISPTEPDRVAGASPSRLDLVRLELGALAIGLYAGGLVIVACVVAFPIFAVTGLGLVGLTTLIGATGTLAAVLSIVWLLVSLGLTAVVLTRIVRWLRPATRVVERTPDPDGTAEVKSEPFVPVPADWGWFGVAISVTIGLAFLGLRARSRAEPGVRGVFFGLLAASAVLVIATWAAAWAGGIFLIGDLELLLFPVALVDAMVVLLIAAAASSRHWQEGVLTVLAIWSVAATLLVGPLAVPVVALPLALAWGVGRLVARWRRSRAFAADAGIAAHPQSMTDRDPRLLIAGLAAVAILGIAAWQFAGTFGLPPAHAQTPIQVGSTPSRSASQLPSTAAAVAGQSLPAQITVGRSPSGVVVAPDGVWVTNWDDNTLSRIDPATNSVVQMLSLTIPGNGGPEAIAYGANSLWVTVTAWDANNNSLPGSLLRVDPVTGTQRTTIAMGRGPGGIAVTPGAVWVALYSDNRVVRVDSATDGIVATIPMAGNPDGVTSGAGSVWVSTDDGHVARIDPATNRVVATIQTHDTGGYVAFGGNAVWVTSGGHTGAADGTVTRIDPASNHVVASVTVGSSPVEIAYGGGSVWVGLFDTPTVVQMSAATNAVLNRVSVAYPVYALAATDHAVWAVHSLPAPDPTLAAPRGVVSHIAY